jgi:hypothetical protein
MPKQKPTPFFGTTTDVNHAFPGIEAIDITITQDTYGHYLQRDWQRSSRFSKSTIPSHFRCANPRCQQGGLNLQNIVLFLPDCQHEFSCNGHEGTPAGRKKGDPCDHRFTVQLSVTKTASTQS